jgi:hypothetical protein
MDRSQNVGREVLTVPVTNTSNLLEYNAMWSVENQLTFRMNMSSLSSG